MYNIITSLTDIKPLFNFLKHDLNLSFSINKYCSANDCTYDRTIRRNNNNNNNNNNDDDNGGDDYDNEESDNNNRDNDYERDDNDSDDNESNTTNLFNANNVCTNETLKYYNQKPIQT